MNQESQNITINLPQYYPHCGCGGELVPLMEYHSSHGNDRWEKPERWFEMQWRCASCGQITSSTLGRPNIKSKDI